VRLCGGSLCCALRTDDTCLQEGKQLRKERRKKELENEIKDEGKNREATWEI
jgi:hypothetical protein